MSSPTIPLLPEIEDAFSFNFPDYISASPEYVSASPGKTYSSSSNNSFGVVPIVSQTLSLCHVDPYMKKFEMEKALVKVIMTPKKDVTYEAPTMSRMPFRKLVARQCFRKLWKQQALTWHILIYISSPREDPYWQDKCSYKGVYEMLHINFKENVPMNARYKLLMVQKLEDEFYHLTVKGNDLKTYVRRFQELATLCPTMVPDSKKMMEVFIGGLPRSIEGNVTASKPQTLEEAINIAQRLMDQNKGPATGSNLLPVTVTCHACLISSGGEEKDIMQISAERPPTTMPREEPTC
ncbi:hypothetical protein Tco_0462517 [Tanacetum coccineum]